MRLGGNQRAQAERLCLLIAAKQNISITPPFYADIYGKRLKQMSANIKRGIFDMTKMEGGTFMKIDKLQIGQSGGGVRSYLICTIYDTEVTSTNLLPLFVGADGERFTFAPTIK